MTKPRPESEFPTIADLRDGLTELIEQGFGDLPIQLLVVPDSTLQAINGTGANKPALMIDLIAEGSPRMPVSLISSRFVGGKAMPSLRKQ